MTRHNLPCQQPFKDRSTFKLWFGEQWLSQGTIIAQSYELLTSKTRQAINTLRLSTASRVVLLAPPACRDIHPKPTSQPVLQLKRSRYLGSCRLPHLFQAAALGWDVACPGSTRFTPSPDTNIWSGNSHLQPVAQPCKCSPAGCREVLLDKHIPLHA